MNTTTGRVSMWNMQTHEMALEVPGAEYVVAAVPNWQPRLGEVLIGDLLAPGVQPVVRVTGESVLLVVEATQCSWEQAAKVVKG